MVACTTPPLHVTIGICPAFGVKYVNTWLYDDKRHDHYNYMRTKNTPNDNKEQLNEMLSTLKKQLRMYKTEKKESQELLVYVETYPTRSPISCHHNLSLQCKLHLPMMIWQHLTLTLTIALVILSWANKTRYHRVSECCKVDIWKPAHVALIDEPIELTSRYVHPSLYSALGKMFNCNERFLGVPSTEK